MVRYLVFICFLVVSLRSFAQGDEPFVENSTRTPAEEAIESKQDPNNLGKLEELMEHKSQTLIIKRIKSLQG